MTEPTSSNPYAAANQPISAAILPGGTGLMREGNQLSLGYDLSVEDVIGFSLHHASTSPAHRKAFYRSWFIQPIAVAALVSIPLLMPGAHRQADVWLLVAIGWFMALGFFVTYPWRFRQRIARSARTLFAQGKNLSITGAWRLEVTPEKLTTYSPLIESHVRWPAVERIDRTPQALYLFLTAISGVIVPAHAFRDASEMDELYQALLHYQQQGERATQTTW
ncbi:MAG TPA: YcxB family protein [Pirellulaceae bacterium]|nr:YcxB family protein [Pirellulaceae bacterium]